MKAEMGTIAEQVGVMDIINRCETFDDVVAHANDLLTLHSLGDKEQAVEARQLHTLSQHGPRAVAFGYLALVYARQHGTRQTGWEAAHLLLEAARKTKKKEWKRLLREVFHEIGGMYAWAGAPPFPEQKVPMLSKRKTNWQIQPKPRTADEYLSLANMLLYMALVNTDEVSSSTTCNMLGTNALYWALERITKKKTTQQKSSKRAGRKR